MPEFLGITQLLREIENGDQQSANVLLEIIYDQLRAVAANHLVQENSQQSLQTTALVHEAYMKLFGKQQQWNSRRHFFAAASIAMRRILIEQSRKRLSMKRGGGAKPLRLQETEIKTDLPDEEILALHEALDEFAKTDPEGAQLVQLRFFAGLSMVDAAETLAISERSAYELWAYARAWLKDRLDSI
ncbi:MAG: ECF-type sigma factor [Pirellulales bacterium]